MTVRIAIAVFGFAGLLAQTPPGEIAGRISDERQAVLPGVRIRITNEDQSREVVTDRGGRFLVRSLNLGTYTVSAELAGFAPSSGHVTLSSSTSRALLTWSLNPGCLSVIDRVIFGPREAAPLTNAIVHMRVASNAGAVRMSDRPDCQGFVYQEYVIDVLRRASERSGPSPSHESIYMEPRDTRLTPGNEYIALLWSDAHTDNDLVLPIVSGRVVSRKEAELNGLGPREALDILAKWSKKK